MLEAARILLRHQIGGAPVVDGKGKCVGLLSTSDFVRSVGETRTRKTAEGWPVCPFQVEGKLLSGETSPICILAEGDCKYRKEQPSLGGRHVALCQKKPADALDLLHLTRNLPEGMVTRYMTADFVNASTDTHLPDLARMMINAHIHRVVIMDENERLVGIVSSTDLLAALVQTEGTLA